MKNSLLAALIIFPSLMSAMDNELELSDLCSLDEVSDEALELDFKRSRESTDGDLREDNQLLGFMEQNYLSQKRAHVAPTELEIDLEPDALDKAFDERLRALNTEPFGLDLEQDELNKAFNERIRALNTEEDEQECEDLLEKGALFTLDDEEYIDFAAASENPRLCRFLVKLACSPDKLLEWAIFHSSSTLYPLCIELGVDRNKGLAKAIEAFDKPLCNLLLEAGATIKAVEVLHPGLLCAICNKKGSQKIAFISFIIDLGADVNLSKKSQKNKPINFKPLMAAAKAGSNIIVEKLLAAGALVDERNWEGKTALFFAAHQGHTEIVRMLLDHGAYVDAAVTAGRAIGHTPLSIAADKRNHELCDILVRSEADPTIKNHITARTPLIAAAQNVGSHEICRTLALYTPLCTLTQNTEQARLRVHVMLCFLRRSFPPLYTRDVRTMLLPKEDIKALLAKRIMLGSFIPTHMFEHAQNIWRTLPLKLVDSLREAQGAITAGSYGEADLIEILEPTLLSTTYGPEISELIKLRLKKDLRIHLKVSKEAKKAVQNSPQHPRKRGKKR